MRSHWRLNIGHDLLYDSATTVFVQSSGEIVYCRLESTSYGDFMN
jgi:hypothetical protein